MNEKTLEEQIVEKTSELGQAMLAALKDQKVAIKAEMQHRRDREWVMQVELELRNLRGEAMRLSIHSALMKPLAKPLVNANILIPHEA